MRHISRPEEHTEAISSHNEPLCKMTTPTAGKSSMGTSSARNTQTRATVDMRGMSRMQDIIMEDITTLPMTRATEDLHNGSPMDMGNGQFRKRGSMVRATDKERLEGENKTAMSNLPHDPMLATNSLSILRDTI